MSFSNWFLFFVILKILFFVLLFLPLTLRIKLHNLRDDNNIFLMLQVRWIRHLKLLTLQKVFSWDQEENDEIISLDLLLKQLLQRPGRLPDLKQLGSRGNFLLRLGSALDWHELLVLLRIGTGDAAATGMSIGFMRSLVGSISYILNKKWRFKNARPLLLVYPYFLEKKLTYYVNIECSLVPGPFICRLFLAGKKNKEVTRRCQKNIPSRT